MFNAPSFPASKCRVTDMIRFFCLFLACIGLSHAQTPSFAERLVQAAMERTKLTVRYEPAYVRLDYPNGDVPADTGVCTDEIIRCYRTLGFDLQKLVHEDMKRALCRLPENLGLKSTDKNIDHRRVPNLQTFFKRRGASLPVTQTPLTICRAISSPAPCPPISRTSPSSFRHRMAAPRLDRPQHRPGAEMREPPLRVPAHRSLPVSSRFLQVMSGSYLMTYFARAHSTTVPVYAAGSR
jgi:uncharacterized protein YijF (DUF1287 family)